MSLEFQLIYRRFLSAFASLGTSHRVLHFLDEFVVIEGEFRQRVECEPPDLSGVVSCACPGRGLVDRGREHYRARVSVEHSGGDTARR